MKKLSIIIVSYNNYEILKECIQSIYLYNDIGEQLEIIISDNSPDNYVIEFLNKDFPNVKTIKNDNIGFGPGNNRGYEISEGEILLFLNPDTIFIEPICQYAIKKFDEDTELALFGISLVDKNLKKNDSFFLMDENRMLFVILFKLLRFANIYIDNKMYISGANIFVRRKCFEEAGGFDENIFMYYEEPDLIKRIKMNCESKKTRFFREKKMIHLEGGTESKDVSSIVKKISRNLQTFKYYCEKWNMNFEQNVCRLMKYEKLKYVIYKVFNKSIEFQLSSELVNLYQKYLEIDKR